VAVVGHALISVQYESAMNKKHFYKILWHHFS